MSAQGRARRYARNGRRRSGVLSPNVLPVEHVEQAGGLALSVDQGGEAHQPAGSTQPATINAEEHGDIYISSLRAFEEAKNKSRRRTLVVDAEDEEVAIRLGLIQSSKRRRGHPNPPIINCELFVNLEGSNGSMIDKAQNVAPLLPPPPPKEPTFSCPVCMDPLVEEVATKCGHVFCKACITAAINSQHKCPACRKRLTNKNLIRLYLPTSK